MAVAVASVVDAVVEVSRTVIVSCDEQGDHDYDQNDCYEARLFPTRVPRSVVSSDTNVSVLRTFGLFGQKLGVDADLRPQFGLHLSPC